MSADQDSAWQTLLDAGLVSGAEPPVGELESPWYVRLMLGVVAWIAALLLLLFVAAALAWIIRSKPASLFTGLSMLGLAWWLLWKFGKQDFMSQFALAVSFAGQVLFAVGVFGWFGVELQSTTSWIIMTLAQAMLALVMPNTIHGSGRPWQPAFLFYMLLLRAACRGCAGHYSRLGCLGLAQ
jgi:hypothetical protein